MKKILFSIVVGLLMFVAPAHADTLGQQQTFRVNKDYDEQGRTHVTATVRHVSDHAYFYVDDTAWAEFSQAGKTLFLEHVTKLGNEFDTIMYPREREFFGSEPNPGLDGDPRTVILLQSLKRGNGGYFEVVNVFPKEDYSTSNEREMIAVSVDAIGTSFARSFLTHEFQHLISINQKEILRNVSEEVWLNELRSEYAITLAGFNSPYVGSSLESRANAFIRNPSDSITEWPNVSQDYNSVAVFGEYLAGRYGQGILQDTMRISSKGIDSFNRFFTNRGVTERFPDVFGDWMVANYLNDGSIRFGYANPDLRQVRVQAQHRDIVRNNTIHTPSSFVKDWQPVWQEFVIGEAGVGLDQAVKLEFTAPNGENFLISYVIFYNDGSYDVERTTVSQGSRTVYVVSGNPFGPFQLTDKPISKILVALTKTQKVEGFGSEESPSMITTDVALVSKELVQATANNPNVVFNSRAQVLRDGALIRRGTEQDVYVITGKYKRYMSPEAIRLYGHLDIANVISVDGTTFNSYETSYYIRAINTEPVYAIWWDNTRHWLNVSAAQWEASGRDWNAIFVVNAAELNFYARGTDLTR